MKEKSLIKLFSIYHDFVYFDSLSDNTKKMFREIIEHCKVKSVVGTIIWNHLMQFHPSPIRRVIGPISMVIMSYKDKMFYLFGDLHRMKIEKCPPNENVPEFGIELLRHLSVLDKIIDLFIETTHLKVSWKANEYVATGFVCLRYNIDFAIL